MSRTITTFPLAITQSGWVKQEQCNCGGILKVKFSHTDYPGVILEWWVKHYAFKAVKSNKTVQPQTSINKLDNWLQDYKLETAALSPKKVAKVQPVTEPVKVAESSPQEPAEVEKVESRPQEPAEVKTVDVETDSPTIERRKYPKKKK